MRIKFIKIGMYLSVAILASCSEKMAIISLDTEKLNSLKPGEKKAHFTIYNKGNTDLIIENFSSSCGCTVLKLKEGSKIKTYDSLIVPVELTLNQEKRYRIYITLRANSNPPLTSFYFDIPVSQE